MQESDIVLTPIPQAEGIIKNRPVILQDKHLGMVHPKKNVEAIRESPLHFLGFNIHPSHIQAAKSFPLNQPLLNLDLAIVHPGLLGLEAM